MTRKEMIPILGNCDRCHLNVGTLEKKCEFQVIGHINVSISRIIGPCGRN